MEPRWRESSGARVPLFPYPEDKCFERRGRTPHSAPHRKASHLELSTGGWKSRAWFLKGQNTTRSEQSPFPLLTL